MVNVRDDLSLSRLELVVLARLSVKTKHPPDRPDLRDAVRELVLPSESPARAMSAALETLAGLRARGLVINPSRLRKGALGERGLTEEGGRALRAAFGLARTPTWREIRGTHLAALALGFKPGSEPAAKALRGGGTLAAAVLREHFEVREGTTLAAICDALIAEELGLPPGKVTLERIRAHVLARRAGVEAKGKSAEIAKRVVAATVRARNADKKSLAPALGRRWMQEASESQSDPGTTPWAPAQPPPTTAQPPPTTAAGPVAPEALLAMVRETLSRVGSDGRFGDEKVFVSAIWHSLEHDRRLADLSFDRFKRWLVRANRDGWLVLVRADLVGAMDAKLVADSEIEDQGATFHFVLDQRTGTAGAGKTHHVR